MSTDRPNANSSRSTTAISGGRWTVIENLALQALGSLTTAILARLLVPEDFGLVAFALMVTNLMALFREFGFGAHIIHESELDQRRLSTVFWLSGILGLTLTTATFFAAPLFARLLGQAEAMQLTQLAGLILVITLAKGVPDALLLRQLKFRVRSLIAVTSQIAYAVIAISLAYFLGLGAWAVVIAHVVRRAITSGATFVASSWRPSWTFDMSLIADTWRYNLSYFGDRIAEYGAKNLDYWIVGIVTSTTQLGIYYIAYVVPNLVRTRITYAASRVLFPVLASIRTEPKRAAIAFRKATGLVSFIVAPALVGTALVAPNAVPVIFGAGWEEAVLPMQILALSAVIDGLTSVAPSLFLAYGEPEKNLTSTATRFALLAVAMSSYILVPSLTTAAAAVFVSAAASGVVRLVQLRRHRSIPILTLLKDIAPIAASTGFMTLSILVTNALFLSGTGPAAQLTVQIAVGVVSYFGYGLTIHRSLMRPLLNDALRLFGRRGAPS